ncbi:MarR family winged helix-turn-helix transcriptional regulator [uncultured Corynebacterium sp.]|uniref:MarR family winged helix-turn-helix transcriptional regulator n=1 Tax=uncultured Corynebacterium sp. TaxID=159447 RepID=UPI0025D8E8CC|nr:MarR family winged helix-turn-helix transcriptional regulator [uncultured Corynebacterium sp.]
MTTEPRWLNEQEQALWRLILGSIRKINRGMDETLMKGGDLSISEFSVLVALSEADYQQLRLRELCSELEWDRSRTSHQITRMERRGLVEKAKSAGDARGVVVRITEEGLQRLEAAVPGHVEAVRRLVFDHMHQEDVASLTRFFQGVMNVGNGVVTYDDGVGIRSTTGAESPSAY